MRRASERRAARGCRAARPSACGAEPFAHVCGAIRAARVARGCGRRADVQQADEPFVGAEAERVAHRRLVRIGARCPEAAVAELVDRVQHVHRGRADGEQLLDLGYFRGAVQRRAERDDERRGERLRAAVRVRAGRGVGCARVGQLDQQIAECVTRGAADHDEAPRTQVAVIGRAQGGVEDGVEFARAGRRFGQRPAGAARQQSPQQAARVVGNGGAGGRRAGCGIHGRGSGIGRCMRDIIGQFCFKCK
ncbi:hypothetical protein DM52_1401 [Burkholderia mallei]|nr:hypothetical protein DM52_1401 [Burkholderia mallei]